MLSSRRLRCRACSDRLSSSPFVAVAASTCALVAQPSARRPNLTGTVVAVNQQSDSVTLIDLKTMEAYRHVPVVGGPHEAAASPDGRSVVVTNYNKQGVGQQKTLSVLALPSGDTDQDHRPRRVPRAARRALGGSDARGRHLGGQSGAAAGEHHLRRRSSGCSAPRPACRTCWRSPPTARASTARTCATAA